MTPPLRITGTGEHAGSVTAVQLAARRCHWVQIKAALDNAGNVYVGTSSAVTAPDGTTDTNGGYPLDAGEIFLAPVENLNDLWIICDNAGDDILYALFG